MRKTLFNPVVYACAIHLHGLPALNCPNGFTPRFIQTSGEISEFMKMHVINLAYKRIINDPRESPAVKVTESLQTSRSTSRCMSHYYLGGLMEACL